MDQEIRDPVHGFITVDDWERDIIHQPEFQRLRRIRQLAWTDMVYPGACHNRFEHSLGVMHVATQMFDNIQDRSDDILREELRYKDAGLERDRALVRLAALLHDVGHAPFSHASEDLMPTRDDGKRFEHEDYSAEIIREFFRDVIENHPINATNYHITADEVAGFITGDLEVGASLFWKDLISGQFDADRADYLLRDSHHLGVAYGHYDLSRFLVTLCAVVDPESEGPRFAVDEGGSHVAEALIVARYMMFTQVYFHHTRRAYDNHHTLMMQDLLETVSGTPVFPAPTSRDELVEYLNWTDWKVQGLLSDGEGGDHGKAIVERRHHRRVFETQETATEESDELAGTIWGRIVDELGEDVGFNDSAKKSWYKFDSSDVLIRYASSSANAVVEPLAERSSVVSSLTPVNQIRLYSNRDVYDRAREIVVEENTRSQEAFSS